MFDSAHVNSYPPGPSLWRRLRSPGLLRLNTHEFVIRNARAHGDLIHYKAFGRHVFQFNHPDMVPEVLIRDEALHRRGLVMQRARFILGEGLLTSEEPAHMRQRRLAQPAFQPARLGGYAGTMTQFAREMTARWESRSTFDIHRSMLELTLRIAGKCFFDRNVETEVPTISKAVTDFMGFLPLAFLPFPGVVLRMPIGFARRIRASRKMLNGMIDAMIAERRSSGEVHGDLLSMLIASADGQNQARVAADRQIRDECLTLLLAGHETTANGLSFCFYLMAQHPEIQERVRAEAAAVFPDRDPCLESQSGPGSAQSGDRDAADDVARYNQLSYTGRVVAEALRLYPPVWVTARTAAVSYSYRDVSIPAGSLLLVPQIAIHRDPRFYPDPMRFDPDRFLPDAVAGRPRFAYFPFGAGPRMCLGENFAWMEIALVLALVVRDWKLTLAQPASGPDSGLAPAELALDAQVTLRPRNGVVISATRRDSPKESH